jgi:hypothetical protein
MDTDSYCWVLPLQIPKWSGGFFRNQPLVRSRAHLSESQFLKDGSREDFMSTFSEQWGQCMRGKGLPVPDIEGVNEAVDLLEHIHEAIENTGDAEVTIGALLAAGALVGIDEAALAVLGEVAQVAAALYLLACTACLGSVAIDKLRGLFASNELPGFLVAQLESQGVELSNQAVV